MRTLLTAEIIPSSRIPVQGTIVADIDSVDKNTVVLIIHNFLAPFFTLHETVPVILRVHSVKGSESAFNIKIVDINPLPDKSFTFLTANFTDKSPSTNLIEQSNIIKYEESIKNTFS